MHVMNKKIKKILNLIECDAPVNTTSGIDGIGGEGKGKNGEPGVNLKKKKNVILATIKRKQ